MELIKKRLFDLFETAIVFFKVVFFSKFFLKLPKTRNKNLIYFANGPSLRANFERVLKLNPTADIMVSNYFYKSNYFFDIKPKYYTICDPSFKYDTVMKVEMFKNFYVDLFRIVNWELYLFVPYVFKKDINNIIKCFDLHNDFIKILHYNSINFNIDNFIVNKLFDLKLGIPSPSTVAVPSVMLGIFMGYKNIGIAGVDMNMHQKIIVGKDNILKIVDDHFYDITKVVDARPFYRETAEKITFTSAEIFLVFHKMLKSFDAIGKYARYRNVKIVNYSKESFLDQFDKM